uniref:translation initiation factor IF-2-like n=1 Tax=Arvicanthis niloticus TaxID=61156 RepID=UPI0014868960|nr:translation initiation factor IF-2-like [Arvicanthis niloticus]
MKLNFNTWQLDEGYIRVPQKLQVATAAELGPGTHARARGAGAREGDPPEPRRARARAGRRGSPPRGGEARAPRPGQGRTARYLGSAPRFACRFPGPARGVRPRRPLSAPRTAPAGPLELRSRPAAGGLARGRRLRSRAPAPGTAAERSAAREGPPEDGGRAGTNTGSATRAAPLPQRRRRPGPCCCCQLVGRTLSMRARRPHPDFGAQEAKVPHFVAQTCRDPSTDFIKGTAG